MREGTRLGNAQQAVMQTLNRLNRFRQAVCELCLDRTLYHTVVVDAYKYVISIVDAYKYVITWFRRVSLKGTTVRANKVPLPKPSMKKLPVSASH